MSEISEEWRICEECPYWQKYKESFSVGYCPLIDSTTMEDRICPISDYKFGMIYE